MRPPEAALYDAAAAAARAASELLVDARPDAIRSKSNPKDLVTEWDLRSEELIRTVLEERVPGIAFLGEEGGETPVRRAGCAGSSIRSTGP